jgi:hypothetical protein
VVVSWVITGCGNHAYLVVVLIVVVLIVVVIVVAFTPSGTHGYHPFFYQ